VLASERFRDHFIQFLRKKTGHAEPKGKSNGIMVYRGIRKKPVDVRATMTETVRDHAHYDDVMRGVLEVEAKVLQLPRRNGSA
jgi:hypothetical protein